LTYAATVLVLSVANYVYALRTLIFTTHQFRLVFFVHNKARKKSTLFANTYWPLFHLPIS